MTQADHPPVPPGLVLAVAVTAISAAAVLVRLAPDASPVALAFWRTGVVGLLLAASFTSATQRRELARATTSDRWVMAFAGLLLAGHFWAWFESLRHTTVLRSTLLVCLNPVWAGLLGWWLLGERPSRGFFWGIPVAVVGVAILSGGSLGGGALVGDLLALLGGVLAALYLLAGRRARARVGIGPYGATVCLVCAVALLPVAALTGAPLTGFAPSTWLAIAGLTLGPQLLGHIGLNYSVRFLSAATVSAVVLVEPVGAAALGALVLGEIPTGQELLGGAVVLVGVGIATLR